MCMHVISVAFMAFCPHQYNGLPDSLSADPCDAVLVEAKCVSDITSDTLAAMPTICNDVAMFPGSDHMSQ